MSKAERLAYIAAMPCRTLGQKRELFARCQAELTLETNRLGYEIRWDELKRGDAQAEWNASHCRVYVDGKRCEALPSAHRGIGASRATRITGHKFKPIGSRNTLHKLALAIDGYLRRPPSNRILWATKHYRTLGLYWESLHPLCYWGGSTDKPGDRLKHDGGHFSVIHGGVQ